MKQFTGYEYILIDVANAFGLSKESWDIRLNWVKENIDVLDAYIPHAQDKLLYIKAVNALREVQSNEPTDHLIELDSTCSGAQIMAVLTGCRSTAIHTNLIDSVDVQDLYMNTVVEMNNHLPKGHKIGEGTFTRKDVKRAVMTAFYGSKATPKEIFGEDSVELVAFYNALKVIAPGCLEIMEDLLSCWDSTKEHYSWTLPDGFIAHIDVRESETYKVEIDELSHGTFTYITEVIKPSTYAVPIIANVIQSYDAYICREMIRRCYKSGFHILTIHDAFRCHPNNAQVMREHYRDILVELSKSNPLEKVISELLGREITYKRLSEDLHIDIYKSEYTIC